MPRLSLRLALSLLCAPALLSACAPAAASVSVAATATHAAPTPTATLAPAPTPTNVPDGWLVLDTPHFSIAYPSDWTSRAIPQMDGSLYYLLTPPTSESHPSVSVSVTTANPNAKSQYCMSSSDIQHTTLAGLPMTFMISGEGSLDRSWGFSNTQSTSFGLAAGDAQDSSDVQAQDDAILATFRPDNADPLTC